MINRLQFLPAAGQPAIRNPATSVPFVPGHILGGILLGIALWRVIPKWAATH